MITSFRGRQQFRQILGVQIGGGLFAALFAFSGVQAPAVAEGISGLELADRFARDGEMSSEEQRKRDEREMLERARREQERARKTQSNSTPSVAANKATPDVIEVRPKSEPTTRPAPAVDAGKADGGTVLSDETLAAERAEEEKLRAEVARRIEEAKRAAELDQVVERLRRVRESSAPPIAVQSDDDATADASFKGGQKVPATVEPVASEGEESSPPPLRAASNRATVLLVMEPGKRGIRRFNKSGDPVLCLRTQCYISRGPEHDAEAMSRSRALGTVNTLGRRAGACKNSLGCVFRNVDLGGEAAWVQPIDLRIMRHDRRQPGFLRIDRTCGEVRGEVVCSQGIVGSDYRVWVLSEDLATRVTPKALTAVIGNGLTLANSSPQSTP